MVFKVTDDIGTTDTDTATVTVTEIIEDDTPPTVEITSPTNGLYINNKKIMPLPFTIILFGIDIEVTASDEVGGSGMNRVEFYIDGSLKHTASSPPYIWTWYEKHFSNTQ